MQFIWCYRIWKTTWQDWIHHVTRVGGRHDKNAVHLVLQELELNLTRINPSGVTRVGGHLDKNALHSVLQDLEDDLTKMNQSGFTRFGGQKERIHSVIQDLEADFKNESLTIGAKPGNNSLHSVLQEIEANLFRINLFSVTRVGGRLTRMQFIWYHKIWRPTWKEQIHPVLKKLEANLTRMQFTWCYKI